MLCFIRCSSYVGFDLLWCMIIRIINLPFKLLKSNTQLLVVQLINFRVDVSPELF